MEVTLVTSFGIVPLELVHEAQVSWATLELDGAVWAVMDWSASASSFAPLENNGAEMEKTTIWERKGLVYHQRMPNWKRRCEGL